MNQQLDQIKAALPGLIPNCGDCVVITIDGPAGSGKTSLALTLKREIASSYTIHMDELYEGWGSTMTPALTTKLVSILESVDKEENVFFTPFNWLENSPGIPISVPAFDYRRSRCWAERDKKVCLPSHLDRSAPGSGFGSSD